jgi:signal recognition particle subunit SEC65
MSTLKGLLFNQYATEGLSELIEEMQSKYSTKKGRRFNHDNITYEISRPSLKENSIEFEISSKIPEDEIKNPKEMQAYFQQIKKVLEKGKNKPVSIEMENIVWDSRKDNEKKRDYVKLQYQCPLDDLFDDSAVAKQHDKVMSGKDSTPSSPSTFTKAGSLVLDNVRESMLQIGRDSLAKLMDANQQIKASRKG